MKPRNPNLRASLFMAWFASHPLAAFAGHMVGIRRQDIRLHAFLVAVIACQIHPLHAGQPLANPRDMNFDGDWRFFRGNAPGAENPSFDDAGWRLLDLPHDWSIGNGIPRRADERGYGIAKNLADEVRRLDPTRPVTEAVCNFWDQPGGNPLRNALRPVPETAVFKMDGYYLWDPSLIKVGDTYHLFASRWPVTSERMKGWLKSHVIRATSKSLFGPYQFQEIVLSPSKHPWATQAVHNPKVMKTGNRFLIYHLGIPQWKTGFAYADSIEGPWTPVPQPVLSTNNPAIIERPDGSAYAVGKFKPAKPKDGQWDACMQAFEADSINGPYKLLGGPGNRLPDDFELEDPTLWWAGNRYNVICTDWEAKATGVQKAVVYYTSKNGIDYELDSRTPVWSQRDPVPLRDGASLKISGVERPQVFLDENGALVALLAGIYPANRDKESTFIVIRPVDHFIPGN